MTTNFPVPQETVEAGLLNAIGQNMANWLQAASFEQEDFVAHRDVFRFMGDYLQQYGSLPSTSQISTRFDWHPPIGDFAYWLTEMNRYSLARKVMAAIKDGYDRISNPKDALTKLINDLSLINAHGSNHAQATDYTASERLAMFDVRTDNIFKEKHMVGIRTGHHVIDDTLVGWTPGSFVGCYARPGVGKTWWLMDKGAIGWMDGHSVLAIAPEMPANWLNLRVDVLIGAHLGFPIDYSKLITGDPSIRQNYEMITNVMSQSQRWWTYDSKDERALSVGDIADLIRQHNPSMVLIDGVGLLRSSSRGQTWEQMREVCYGLKNIATAREVPILATHQSVNSAKGRRSEPNTIVRGDDFVMPSLNDAADGESFVRACSDIITMCGEPQSQYINWYSLRKYRERGWKQPLPVRMALACDFGKGHIVDLSHLGHAVDAVGQEVKRLFGV